MVVILPWLCRQLLLSENSLTRKESCWACCFMRWVRFSFFPPKNREVFTPFLQRILFLPAGYLFWKQAPIPISLRWDLKKRRHAGSIWHSHSTPSDLWLVCLCP